MRGPVSLITPDMREDLRVGLASTKERKSFAAAIDAIVLELLTLHLVANSRIAERKALCGVWRELLRPFVAIKGLRFMQHARQF